MNIKSSRFLLLTAPFLALYSTQIYTSAKPSPKQGKSDKPGFFHNLFSIDGDDQEKTPIIQQPSPAIIQSKNSSNSRFQSPLSDVSSDQNNHLKLTRDLVWQRRLLIKEKYALQLVIREKNRPLVKIKKSFIVYRQSLINHLIQKLRSIQYQT